MSRRRIDPIEEEPKEAPVAPEEEKFVECLKGHNMYLSEGTCKKCSSPAKLSLEVEKEEG
jgi:hypothetical protein